MPITKKKRVVKPKVEKPKVEKPKKPLKPWFNLPPIPHGYRKSSMLEALEKKKVNMWGYYRIDSKLINKSLEEPEVEEEIKVEPEKQTIPGLVGKFHKLKKDYEKSNNTEEKKKILLEIEKTKKEIIALNKILKGGNKKQSFNDFTLTQLKQIAKIYNQFVLIEDIENSSKNELIKKLEKHLYLEDGNLKLKEHTFEIKKKQKVVMEPQNNENTYYIENLNSEEQLNKIPDNIENLYINKISFYDDKQNEIKYYNANLPLNLERLYVNLKSNFYITTEEIEDKFKIPFGCEVVNFSLKLKNYTNKIYMVNKKDYKPIKEMIIEKKKYFNVNNNEYVYNTIKPEIGTFNKDYITFTIPNKYLGGNKNILGGNKKQSFNDFTLTQLKHIAKTYNNYILFQDIDNANKNELINEIEKHLYLENEELKLKKHTFEITKSEKQKKVVETVKPKKDKTNAYYISLLNNEEQLNQIPDDVESLYIRGINTVINLDTGMFENKRFIHANLPLNLQRLFIRNGLYSKEEIEDLFKLPFGCEIAEFKCVGNTPKYLKFELDKKDYIPINNIYIDSPNRKIKPIITASEDTLFAKQKIKKDNRKVLK